MNDDFDSTNETQCRQWLIGKLLEMREAALAWEVMNDGRGAKINDALQALEDLICEVLE